MARIYSIEAKRKSNVRYRTQLREWMASLKAKPCTDCGGEFHHSAMHWDHLPEHKKDNGLARMMTVVSKEKMMAEIKKCELVCANCHSVRTWARSNPTAQTSLRSRLRY